MLCSTPPAVRVAEGGWVKTRLIFWVFAAPLWCVSGLLALVSILRLLDAPNEASENRQQRAALLKRAEFVDHYLETKGRVPQRKSSSRLPPMCTMEPFMSTSCTPLGQKVVKGLSSRSGRRESRILRSATGEGNGPSFMIQTRAPRRLT